MLGFLELAMQNGVNMGTTIDALRDSAVSYYALFFFVGMVLASDANRFATFASRWKWCWLLAVPWKALNAVTGNTVSNFGLRTQSGIPILSGSGEVTLSLGLGCLLVLTDSELPRGFTASLRVACLMIGLAVFAGTGGRGVRLAIIAAFFVGILASLRQPGHGKTFRRLLSLLLLAMAGLAIALALGVDVVGAAHLDRFEAIANSDESGDESIDQAAGTATWRSDWWKSLTDEVLSRNPLFGLGFGDPLTEYNPRLAAGADATLRAPHNYNVTVFARMGILGALVWSGILYLGIFRQVWKVVTAKTPQELSRARQLTFWVGCLVAIWVNASFDVQMEGPVAAIPFWLILGIVARGARRSSFPGRLVYISAPSPASSPETTVRPTSGGSLPHTASVQTGLP
jgi:hypothetical protein